jgi:hypothetical protein
MNESPREVIVNLAQLVTFIVTNIEAQHGYSRA